MSPIVVRSAARAVQRRQFSLLSAMRTVGRSMESHPFERLPISQQPAKPDYAKMFKRVGSQALFFFPGFAVILGWPLAAEAAFDGRL
ncbi:hypothetical protein NCS52_00104500 [Fusarium sp. LHS14.1]|uniref:Pantothenate transporter liz1 n=3 Tax=Fusarium solani species complex TaxID=232080 RepID=A0A9W8R946_9HYPO|nr:uncharacterized protein B0J15DRAFT_592642 [Fusarium solani]XP_052913597.1 hypothetical protein NCS57_00755600 [Fusarium keratoplasticum]XP_053008564.1 Hypothetical protein NCS54_00715500 [Fusarium falciforme]KAI8725337.1 hypothetical protein NCS52_00104500 [Fusarium sp. LHS14.1]KAH7266205.1 hypothetical protein B0J15DRAFT_592642 [Fusarium solani]KAI8669406.1 hypothetical protein NCS57_00755600 [Fusarium keratoplasticum]KAI8674006.1 hypothetical protein NCS55_00723200 [Fusarium keratoplasti